MPWGETISDFIRTRQGRKASERDAMWAKLMDIANTGSDLYKTLSGRKYQTGEREAEQAYNTEERIGSQAYSAGESEKARGFQAEQGLTGREYDARQAELDRQLQRELEASRLSREMGDKSERRMSFLAEWTQRAYQLALSNPMFLDENGQFDMTKKEELRKFLYSQVNSLPQLSKSEVDWAKQSFDGYVDSWAGTGEKKPSSDQTPLFNPPAAQTPPKSSAVSDISSLVNKVIRARKLPGIDKDTQRILDYIQGQLPRAGVPGGSDYRKNPSEWLATAIETVNRLLGVVTPQNTEPGMVGIGNPLLK